MFSELRKPIRTANGLFKCRICPRAAFKSQKWYENHLKTEHQTFFSTLVESGVRQTIVFQETQTMDPSMTEPDLSRAESALESPLIRNDEISEDISTRQPDQPKLFVPKLVLPIKSAGVSYGSFTDPVIAQLKENPWFPFPNINSFKLAQWLIEEDVSQKGINRYFNHGIGSDLGDADEESFESSYGLRQKIEQMSEDLGINSFQQDIFDFGIEGHPGSPYFYRDPLEIIAYLLRQRSYASEMHFIPEKLYSETGERQFTEIWTADWWHKEQESLPSGHTVIPILCASDTTHLSNFSGDKKAWPIYLSIGNIDSKYRNQPSNHAWMLLALLPNAPKKGGLRPLEKKSIDSKIHDLMAKILKSLNKYSRGLLMNCGDGQQRICHFRLCGWIADHMEHINLLGIAPKACPVCTVPTTALQDFDQTLQYPERDYDSYAERLDDGDEFGKAQLRLEGVTGPAGAFLDLGVAVGDLHKPDLLHCIYLGMVKHIMEWVTKFLRKYKRLNFFNKCWASAPAYPGFQPFQRSYTQVSQWQGKEMRSVVKILVATLASALRDPSNRERSVFAQAINCVNAFISFVLYATYSSHTEQTLIDMQDQLQKFHDMKDIFREFRGAGTGPQWENAESEEEGSDDEALDESDEEFLENGHFNFIKIHLMTHFTSSIEKFGQLNAWSTEIGEASHVEQLKEGWIRSNHRDAYAQMIEHRYRKHQFRMRFLNLRQLVKDGEKIEGFEQVYPESLPPRQRREQYRKNRRRIKFASVKARIEPYSTPSIPSPSDSNQPQRILKSPANRKKWDTINDIQKEYSIPDLTWALYAYLRTLPVSQTLLRSDFHPSSLADFRAQVYRTLTVPIEDFQSRNIFTNHIIRTNPNWQRKGPRKDFIIFQKSDTSQYGDLRGKGIAKLELLLILHNGISNKTFQLAFVTELKPYAGGTIQSPHGFVRLNEYPLVDYEKENHQSYRNVIPIRVVLGLAHLVPYGVGSYLLNTHIDLNTWNEIYPYEDEDIALDILVSDESDVEEFEDFEL